MSKNLGKYPKDIQKSKKLVSYETILKHTKQPSLRNKLKKQMKKKSKSITRGWNANSPQQGKQRDKLMKKCGNKCFLVPSRKMFPICRKCYGNKCSCRASCRGIKSAKMRAKQFGYKKVAKIAESLDRKLCQRKKSRFTRRKSRRKSFNRKKSIKYKVHSIKRKSKMDRGESSKSTKSSKSSGVSKKSSTKLSSDDYLKLNRCFRKIKKGELKPAGCGILVSKLCIKYNTTPEQLKKMFKKKHQKVKTPLK